MIYADTKLTSSWYVGARDAGAAQYFIGDLAHRLAHLVQVTGDGHKPYLEAVKQSFVADIDFAQLMKQYGDPIRVLGRYSPGECVGTELRRAEGRPNPAYVSTSHAERANLTMRMGMRRFTRLTNAFSKKAENHAHTVSLHMLYYNFVRIHKTLRCTPAMAAGVATRLWDIRNIISLIEAVETRKSS